jgi:hypothetical protein
MQPDQDGSRETTVTTQPADNPAPERTGRLAALIVVASMLGLVLLQALAAEPAPLARSSITAEQALPFAMTTLARSI